MSDDCNSLAETAASLWDKYGAIAKVVLAATGPEGDVIVQSTKIAEEFVDGWNKLAGNGPLTIGKRFLEPNKLLTGTVDLGSQRMFVGSPAKADAEITFTKTGGKAVGDVVVCMFDQKGGHKDVARFQIGDDCPDGKSFHATIPAAHVPSLLIDSNSTFHGLSYSVRLKYVK